MAITDWSISRTSNNDNALSGSSSPNASCPDTTLSQKPVGCSARFDGQKKASELAGAWRHQQPKRALFRRSDVIPKHKSPATTETPLDHFSANVVSPR